MLAGGLAGAWFRESLAMAGQVTIMFAICQHLIRICLAFENERLWFAFKSECLWFTFECKCAEN